MTTYHVTIYHVTTYHVTTYYYMYYVMIYTCSILGKDNIYFLMLAQTNVH